MTDMAMKTTEVDGVTKYTIAFPLTDESGQPILDRANKPRFTNLIADSPEELVGKIAESNLEVSRALDRANKHIDTLKNKKPTRQAPPPDLKGKPLTQEETIQVGLDAQDPRKAAAAIQRVVESVVPVPQIAGELTRQGQTLDRETRRAIAKAFFAKHPEYDLSANGAMLNQWLVDNGCEFTFDNIEIAFANIQDRLARKPAPPSNDPPPDPNAAPGNEPPNPGTAPAPTRRAPVGGIRDSQASGRPLVAQVLTKQQALDMLYKNPRQYEAWMADPVKNKILNAALASR